MGYYKNLLIEQQSEYEGLDFHESAYYMNSDHRYICDELEIAIEDGDTERAAQLASLLDSDNLQ